MNRVRCSDWLTENQNLISMDAAAHEHPLELGCLAHELLVLARRCRSPSPARRRRGCTRTGRTARSRRRSAGAERSAGSTTGRARARVGFSSATTRAPRGFRCSMNRLIVPPLPAASRPSKSMTSLLPGLLDPRLHLEQLDLQRPLGQLVLVPRSSARRTGSPPATCCTGWPSGPTRTGSSWTSSSTSKPALCSIRLQPVNTSRVS